LNFDLIKKYIAYFPPLFSFAMRFNFKFRTAAAAPVRNHEGAPAYPLTPALELYAAVATAALSDQVYEAANTRLTRLRELVAKNNPRFVAQLAVYAREQLYLRSVPLVLTVELARIHQGDNLVSRLVARVVQRADEIPELLAFYAQANGRTGTKTLGRLSKQVQHGLALAFNRFDAYQLAKYDRDGAAVRLRDALFLVHPKPRDEAQQAVFNHLVAGTLPVPYTWETELSAAGQVAYATPAERQAAVARTWENLVASRRLGYMALLRNLRNLLEAKVSAETITQACATLADPGQVARARQLPFRFLAAYREVLALDGGALAPVLAALEQAIVGSVANLRGFGPETRVVVACDVSGSMQKPISPRSKVVTGMFGDTWKRVALPQGQVLRNVQELYRREGEVGYSTNGYLVVQDLRQRGEVVDKIMIFTDCQLWDNTGRGNALAQEWAAYRANVAPDARLYLFDLAGYGPVPLDVRAEQGVALIAGWSDKVFDVLAALENGGNALTKIEKIDL
jgi:60 kDa SS-A/Ro ribonucleoprotein